MSLRWRLTFLSTAILAVVFALFGVIAYFSVRSYFYQTITDNMESKTTSILLYWRARGWISTDLFGPSEQIGAVFYTVYNADGSVVYSDRNLTVNPDLFNQVLAGQDAQGTQLLADGTRVQVLLRPFKRPTGEVVGIIEAATPLEIPDRILGILQILFWVSAPILLLAGALGSWLLSGRLLRTVDKVTQKAHEIEKSQDLSQRIPEPRTKDEVGHLVSTFNQMLARLQASFDAQRRFIADSSHELRTPLTVIKSNLHLLRRSTDPRERAELVDTTEAEVSRLNGMVNDLLYMAQMQAGYDLKPVLRAVELDSLLLDVFARARSLAVLKEQKVLLVHEDIAATRGDRDQLQHLLLNLVDNAVKYTPAGGTISLGLWTNGDQARIEVADNGPGIAAAELPYIFERFFRTPEARLAERNGSGLGLAIVKAIAEAHGGRVEVSSVSGEGSIFRLWLRLLPGSRSLPLEEGDEDSDKSADAAQPNPEPLTAE